MTASTLLNLIQTVDLQALKITVPQKILAQKKAPFMISFRMEKGICGLAPIKASR
jgi:hypothetical protein